MCAQQRSGELSFSLEDLTRILRRRMRWFLIPTGIGVLLALGMALGLPPTYEAASTVVVQPPGIPNTLVQTTVVAETESRYGQLRLQILSRDNLSEIIDGFKLYPGVSAPREELVAMMREAISIEPLPPAIIDPRKPPTLESFRIAYRSDNAVIVADVANRLTRDFIAAHLADREIQAKGASEFLQNELLKSRAELGRQLDEVTDYKEAHHGELPEQLPVNTQHVERLRNRLMTMSANYEVARGQARELRKQIEQARLSGASGDYDPLRRQQMLELALNGFIAQGKTEKHPDVVQARAEIAALETMIDEGAASGDGPVSPIVHGLRRELSNQRVTAAVLEKEIQRVESEIAVYEARIENTARHAAGLNRLQSTAANLNDAIRVLQLKLVDARMGHTIELAQKGEKFQVVEWAVPPESPVSPNRPLWFVVGLTLSALAGMACLILREMTDRSFHSVDELQQALPIPVLASVPRIRLPSEMASRRVRLRRLGISSAAIVVLILGATLAFYVYSRSSGSTLAQLSLVETQEQYVDV